MAHVERRSLRSHSGTMRGTPIRVIVVCLLGSGKRRMASVEVAILWRHVVGRSVFGGVWPTSNG